MTLKIYNTTFSDVLLLETSIFSDSRWSFQELYKEDLFQSSGIDTVFIQDNLSVSKKGVIRWLHFQTQKPQAKLIMPLSWSIYDVVIDLRQYSPTFWKYEGYILGRDKSLFVPRGFAHGFLSLEDDTTVLYKCDGLYDPSGESGIIWNDEYLHIDWQSILKEYDIPHPILSEKDAILPSFLEYTHNPLF